MNQTIKLSLLTTLLLNTNLIAEEKLEDITVTSATKTTQNLNDVTSNVNVITSQEIEERHYTTVVEALNSLPGISFRINGGLGTTSSLNLRGMKSNKVLVLIDGIRQNDNTGLNGAPFAHLLATDIERIEVIKGAQSGIWGADASAGVINIITKSAQKGLNFNISQEFGSFRTSQTNANLSYKTDKFYFKINHSNLDSKSFTAYAPKGINIDNFEDDAYSNKTTNLKAGFSITPTNKFDISHTIIDANGNYDDAYNKNANSTVTKNRTKDKFSSINFNHIDSFNELNIYAKKSTFDRASTSAFGTYPFKGEVNEYGLSSKIPYLRESFLLIGGDYKKFEHQSGLNKDYNNKALFITNNNKISTSIGNTIVTESVRYDKYSDFKNKTTGKIGIKQNFNDYNDLSLSANYGTAYNIPTLYNLYGSYVGNSNLTPESTKSYDLTITYKDFSVTYFNSKIDNAIDYDFVTYNYQNLIGTSKIKGYELAYNNTLFDILAFNLAYTHLNTEDNNGQTLARQPKQSVKFGLDYYGFENLHLGLNGEYVGERYDDANKQGQQTGKYTVANFVTNYEVDKHLSLYGKVDNITDKYYQTINNYATSPRAFYAGMKLTY